MAGGKGRTRPQPGVFVTHILAQVSFRRFQNSSKFLFTRDLQIAAVIEQFFGSDDVIESSASRR
jgi:hypothetical protein